MAQDHEPVNYPVMRQSQTLRGIVDTCEWVLIALILAFMFRAFVMEAFRIPTGSMARLATDAIFDCVLLAEELCRNTVSGNVACQALVGCLWILDPFGRTNLLGFVRSQCRICLGVGAFFPNPHLLTLFGLLVAGLTSADTLKSALVL